ncbi:hypothetical protein CPB83DRAFT_852038 [Crepidotus variabilis]|uniref:DUF221-domain-containing protein n=1 Tax=Crepidotus variabilis TaxID=179855 RepID=A0A9P6JRA8_9AGAR|nr:hypothetical protein CPB83DRAFT_852038 [Crepidotus variabilis]
MGDIIVDAGNKIFDDKSRQLAPEAVGSQVVLMTVVSIATVIVFNLLRPKNKVIYEPKVKYHEGSKPPPRISGSIFGWLPPLFNTKEPELLDKIGLDAVTFLRFLRLMRWLFSGITLLTCGILLPINVVYNLKNIDADNRNILTMLTIQDVQGDFLYAHVIVTYLITFLIVVCVDIHWRAMVRLRRTWFRSPEYLQSFYARTLQVRHVPKKLQSDEGIKNIFETVKVPYPTTSVHVGRKVGKLPELIDYHNQTVREFEEILVAYLKGGKIRAKRPTIRIGGTCGMGGQKKDAIDFYTAKLKRTEAAIEEYRTQIDTRKAENYGFASMAAVPYAHIVAKQLMSKHPKGTSIDLAPNPKDIIWENMNSSDAELARKRLLGVVWLIVICSFNTIPLFIISFFANLNAARAIIPPLNNFYTESPRFFNYISGVLPPAISGLFGFFLPIVMRWLGKYMGSLTHSKLDRSVVARYFAFLIISQLIIFTLIGVVFQTVLTIVNAVGKKTSFQDILGLLREVPRTINHTYFVQSSYWLTFFPLRGFLVVFDLAQIINLVWVSLKTHLLGRTPRDIRDWTQPPEFQYAIYYANVLFMGAVALVFAPLAPLVVVAATIVFWMSSWVYKYQLMFVFVSKVESGGRIWNVIINRLLICVLLMQLLMILTMGLQYRFSSYQWVSTLPPILIVAAYKFYINRTYLPAFNYYNPTEDELRLAKVHSERADNKGNRLEKRFGHPALHTELFTPMLHKEMMHLLGQVYNGKISRDKAQLDEYGGQQMEAQVVPGGIRIAAIDQRDLEYDPALYQRDRGELDWDARSMNSTMVFHDNASTSQYNASTSNLPGYNNYLAQGPAGQSEIELSRFDMQTPLIDRRGPQIAPERSYSPSPAYISTDNLMNQAPSAATTPSSYYPPNHQRQPSANMLAGQQIRGQSPGPYNSMNQYPPQQHARQPSGNMLHSQQRSGSPGPYQAYGAPQQQMSPQHARQMSGNMLAQGGRQSPGPYQAYGGQQSSQLARPNSVNMLGSPTPQPMYSQQPPGLQHSQSQPLYGHQQQPSNSSNGHLNNNVAGRGAHRGY